MFLNYLLCITGLYLIWLGVMMKSNLFHFIPICLGILELVFAMKGFGVL